LAVAVLASTPPAPRPLDAPADVFSAARAFVDVQEISQAPHPTGSPEIARVRAYLTERLENLGLEVAVQTAPLTEIGRDRLARWGEPDAEAAEAVNLLAVLPGLDRTLPAAAVMAHYDTVPGSPGAADNSAGVAAALEIVRALRAGPPPHRDLVVVLTDAEELNLDGARAFFGGHPLARRIGVVVNLEARGGAGRSLMFETGAQAGAMMELFAKAVDRPSAHSLAVLIYRLMPNDSDFTVARDQGRAGFNFAFMGAPEVYHSTLDTPEALQLGALQHQGAQALDLIRALTTAPVLPPPGPDAVFSDVLGLMLVIYPVWAGWGLLAVAGALLVLAAARAGRGRVLSLSEGAGGALRALSLLLHAGLLLETGNRLSGSSTGTYFQRLAEVPRLEAQAVVLGLAALAGVLGVARPRRRWLAATPALLLIGVGTWLGGVSPIFIGAGLLAAGAATVPRDGPQGVSGWIGALCLLAALGVTAQAFAPTATPLLTWPLLLAASGAALATALDPKLERAAARIAIVVPAILAGGQVLAMGHLAFLGVGAELASVMAIFVLLVGLLVWPLVPRPGGRPMIVMTAILLSLGVGLALWVRLDPSAVLVPAYLS